MKGRFIPRSRLSTKTREAMYELLQKHFTGVTRSEFLADLEEKNRVLLVEDETGSVQGFSTLLIYKTICLGEPVRVICSGDTIVDPAARNTNILARTWLSEIIHMRAFCGQEKLYWLLICSGYRTYRFLPVFWRDFYPRHDKPTPLTIKKIIDSLASERWGEYYNLREGIVRFPNPQLLCEESGSLNQQRLRDPNVVFFDRKNPGHVRGDELVCLTEISQENLTPIGRRLLRSAEGNERFKEAV